MNIEPMYKEMVTAQWYLISYQHYVSSKFNQTIMGLFLIPGAPRVQMSMLTTGPPAVVLPNISPHGTAEN